MHIAIFNILIQTISTFNILSYIDNIYLSIYRDFLSNSFYEFFANLSIYRIYFTMSKYLREFYHSIKMTTFISFTKSTVFASLAFVIFEFAFVIFFWSFLFCICLDANDSRTQNSRSLYHEHTNSNFTNVSRCNWFTQAKRTQESYHLRKHELKIKNKLKKKMKQLTKQKKKARLIKKRVEKYTCKRCKIKFDSNIKFHEHIRIRHAKKSKTVVSFFAQNSESKFASKQSMFSFFSSFQSIISSLSTSSKLVVESSTISISSKLSFEIASEFLSIETSKKSIFWAEIVSRSIVAFKFSRLSIATFKSMCKSLKNANIVCSLISSRISSSKHQDIRIQKFYLTMNDLHRMFVEKSNSFDLQRHQMRSFFSRDSDKCSFANKCDFIQSRITSYFHAMISSVFKSIKFETFASTHDSIKQSTRTSSFLFRSIFRFFSSSMRISFSTFSRSFLVCKHCQKRSVIYRFTDWVMRNVSRIENNEIFMRMRYWRFASLHSALKKYWSSRNHYFEKVRTCCLLFCSFAFSSNRWSIWKNIKVVVLMKIYLLLWFRLDLTRLIIVSIFYYSLRFQSLDKYEREKMTIQLERAYCTYSC